MEIKFEKKSAPVQDLIVPVFADKKADLSHLPEEIGKNLGLRFKNKDFSGKRNQLCVVLGDSKGLPSRVIYVGLGKRSDLSGAMVREAFVIAARKAKSFKTGQVAFLLSLDISLFAQEIGEGIGMGNYNLGLYQTAKGAEKRKKLELVELRYLFDKVDRNFEIGLKKGLAIASSVNMVRDLVNGPTNIVNEDFLANKSKEIARRNRYKITVLNKKDLERLKMGALLGVNQGGPAGAKLITIEYNPSGRGEDPVILVGKGVLFDSGGYDMKPAQGMDTMHQDMAGAALVLGIMDLLKTLGIRQHVIGVIPVTQNMIDANAQRPNDIVTSFSGKTIQILNTDAEGRLILADALSYAQKKWPKSKAIIDVATLTGSCMAALGDRYAGLFGNDEDLIGRLKKAGDETDEGIWPLPIHADYVELMKDDMADLRNIDRGTYHLAGASKAAAFLRYFIDTGSKWAHIDIAGTAFVQNPKKYDCKYATGYGVRLLIKFLEGL